MANITAQMVKELRESTGAGMMDCKAALTETNGDMTAGAGLAAQEGPVESRQEGRPRRGRRPDRRAGARHQGRRGRGQFGNRLRRPQRPVPGPGQDDRRCRAQRRHRRRKDQGRQGRLDHGGRLHRRHHRQDRREHDAAPRRFARRSARARSAPMCTIRSSTGSARSASWSRSNSPARPTNWRALAAGRHACRRRQSAGGRGLRPRSGGGQAREGRARRQVQAAGQTG